MSSELYIIVLGSVGWLLTVYFGFYRFRQYQWARHKVQYDLFTKINQRSDTLFLRVTTLSGIKNRNEKLRARRHGVLVKYTEHLNEKVFLMQQRIVSPKIGTFWIQSMLNELRTLARQNECFLAELRSLLDQDIRDRHSLYPLLDVVESDSEISTPTVELLYTQLTQ